jgi:hypothetical protein
MGAEGPVAQALNAKRNVKRTYSIARLDISFSFVNTNEVVSSVYIGG